MSDMSVLKVSNSNKKQMIVKMIKRYMLQKEYRKVKHYNKGIISKRLLN